jgi:2'-phosphotransferase
MRTGSQVLIYINVAKAMEGGIKFNISANGVILTEGNQEGFLPKEYFEKVERSDGSAIGESWRTT